MLGVKIKQPADQLDYDIDYSKWLPDDDEILTVETRVDPPFDEDTGTGVVVDSAHVDSPFVKVWCSGGENGETYKVTVIVATRGGRVKEEEFKIRVRDC